MPSRLVPPLLVATLLVPSAAVAQPASAPSLEMPAELQAVERGWMDAAFAEANQTIRDGNANASEAERLRAAMDQIRAAHADGQFAPVASNLVNLRVTAAYYDARAEAEARNDTVGAFLDATQPAYRRAQNDTVDLQRSINDTQRSIGTARALEVLYLGSELVVQGAEQLRPYDQYRSFLRSSGDDTHPRILQLLVQSAVGPRWTMAYASDLLDQARDVDAAGDGPALNHTRLGAAQAFVADRARHHASDDRGDRGAERLLREMNRSAQRGNHVFSMAMGGIIIGSAIHGDVKQGLDEGNISRQQVRSLLEEHGRNYTPLNETLDAGYRGLLQKDALALVEDVLAEEEPANVQLARAVAQLDKAQLVERAILPLAHEEEAASDEEAAGTSGRDILVAVGGGVALGAGAAALGRRYLGA